MAYSDFAHLLADINQSTTLWDAYQKDPATFWKNYNLSQKEMDLLRAKDKTAILKYLGDEYVKAQMINHF